MTQAHVVFERLSRPERRHVISALRDETVGGVLLLVAAALALIVANSALYVTYLRVSNAELGPEALHLHLPVSVWAADGLLAVFFFVAGLELKHELVLGTLSKPAKAAVPIVAALAGMAVPAALYALINAVNHRGSPEGWGIPMATDIAFALAVLAVVGRRLPVALRAFLLTLAVVDDLGAIAVIAIFYTDSLSFGYLAIGVVGLVAYAILQHRRVRSPWIYVPLVAVVWWAVHSSGIHATVAGVAFGLLTRAKPDPGEDQPPTDRLDHYIRPWSAAVCVPIFAFFAAGVHIGDTSLASALTTPEAIGILIGLVIGKPLGVFGGAWLTARFTHAELDPTLRWRDILTVGVLSGMGFTVALFVAGLAFGGKPDLLASTKLAVLAASVVAAALSAVSIRSRNRYYAELEASEQLDSVEPD